MRDAIHRFVALMLVCTLLLCTMPAAAGAEAGHEPLKRIETNIIATGNAQNGKAYGEEQNIAVQIADVYLEPNPLIPGSMATLLCVVDNPARIPYPFQFEVAGCAAGEGYIEHGGDAQVEFLVPADFADNSTIVTIAVGSPDGWWQQGRFEVAVTAVSTSGTATPSAAPPTGPAQSAEPAATPSPIVSNPSASVSTGSSAAQGPSMPDPVPDPVISGYFLFEGRGHKISTGKASDSLKSWARTAGLPAGADVKLESSDSLQIATGDEVLISYANGFSTRYAIVVLGDTAGTGTPGISQLVTLAVLMREGTDDPFILAAGDINDDGAITLTDLIQLVNDIRSPNPAGALMASDPVIFPRGSSNALLENYRVWSRPVTSYLYKTPNGGLTRVEYTDKRVVVEEYDRNLNLVFTCSAAPELPIWGGFYAGVSFNYLIFGQMNRAQSNSAEVIRVVKYDKNWNRIGAASLKGANTTVPFDAGSLRCDEYSGYLYIRTSHEMYTTSDGLNHQANLMMSVRESDMQITDAYYEISNISYGYVSHSFNQFVKIDNQGRIYTIDHGDGHPRGAVFLMYKAKAGQNQFINPHSYDAQVTGTVFQQFPGEDGENATGASIGGFQLTGDGCLCTYNLSGASLNGPRDVYVFRANTTTGDCFIDQITHGANTSTPQAATDGGNSGYIMWMNNSGDNDIEFCYTTYSPNGDIGTIRQADAVSSDCQPIPWNGGVVWYTTIDGSGPVFFTMNAAGVNRKESEGSVQHKGQSRTV